MSSELIWYERCFQNGAFASSRADSRLVEMRLAWVQSPPRVKNLFHLIRAKCEELLTNNMAKYIGQFEI